MFKTYRTSIIVAVAALMATTSAVVTAGEKDLSQYQVGDRRSGYTYATKETQMMQDSKPILT